MYLLCWRRHGGLQYIGMSQDVDRRINAHRKAGRLPFAQLGEPAIEVLHFGLDVYAACDAERREIMARRTMTPHGYNESSGESTRDRGAIPCSARTTYIGYLARLSGWSAWTGPRTRRKQGVLPRPASRL